MADQWNDEWDVDTVYSEEQIESVLNQCGIEIEDETHNDFITLCPYHGNRHTPSFSVSKTSGKFICFNPACSEAGPLVDLVRHMMKYDVFKAKRLILRAAKAKRDDLVERIKLELDRSDDLPLSKIDYDHLHQEFWKAPDAVLYMTELRGFEEDTLNYFNIGYSAAQDVVTVPMHDHKGRPIGHVGRTPDPDDKSFRNSYKLPKRDAVFNMHRAKAAGADSIILQEASFSAMRTTQAGYPNVGALLGGTLTPTQQRLIDRHFSTIIIMTDYDRKSDHIYPGCRLCYKKGFNLCLGHNPGRELARKIEASFPNKRIRWAAYDEGQVYAPGAKDPDEMSDDDIRRCIKNAVSTFEYNSWGLD